MFHSEALARAIHNDRVREIERTSRERRLLQAPDQADLAAPNETDPARSFRVQTPATRSGSACEPA